MSPYACAAGMTSRRRPPVFMPGMPFCQPSMTWSRRERPRARRGPRTSRTPCRRSRRLRCSARCTGVPAATGVAGALDEVETVQLGDALGLVADVMIGFSPKPPSTVTPGVAADGPSALVVAVPEQAPETPRRSRTPSRTAVRAEGGGGRGRAVARATRRERFTITDPNPARTLRLPRTGTASLRRDSHAGDEPLDPLVDRPERVLAQHGALGLVVELEVHPVDGEVAAPLLGAL